METTILHTPSADILKTSAVRDVVVGREIKNATALANSESLKLFENLEQL